MSEIVMRDLVRDDERGAVIIGTALEEPAREVMYLPGAVNAVTVSIIGTSTVNRWPSGTTLCNREATRCARSGAQPVDSMTHSSTISEWSQVPKERPGWMSKSSLCIVTSKYDQGMGHVSRE